MRKVSIAALFSWWFIVAVSGASISTTGPFQTQEQCEQIAREVNKSRFFITSYSIVSKCWEASLDIVTQKHPQKNTD